LLKFFITKVSILFFSQIIYAQDIDKIIKDIDNYFFSLNEFSASFIQENEGELQEGYFYKNDKRIRIDYNQPTKITIILDKNKAMFFNRDLEEIEYFDPKKTIAKIIFEIFNNNLVENFNKHKIDKNIGKFYINVKHEKINYLAEIVFELNPLELRMINIVSKEENISFGLRDHNFNYVFKKNFFSMANPLLK
tara:strand:+ start:786 stop:1364 length:579 start_codon:yes stop_codon:yes gene_type:complete